VLRGLLGVFYALGAGMVFIASAVGLVFGRDAGMATVVICGVLGLIGAGTIEAMNRRARRKRPPWGKGDGT
jgi:hypothetical protein